MPSQYLYCIKPTRDGFLIKSTPEEDAIVSEHFDHLKELTEQGIVWMAGRTLNTDETSHGIVIFVAPSQEQAKAIISGDPAVKAGVFGAELFPFSVTLASEAIHPD